MVSPATMPFDGETLAVEDLQMESSAPASIRHANEVLARLAKQSAVVPLKAALEQRDQALLRIAELKRELQRLRETTSAQSAKNRRLSGQIDAQNGEMDEMRALVLELQEELSRERQAADDTRIDLCSKLEAARDENIALQAETDEAYRLVDELRDSLADEQHRHAQDLAELYQELHARRQDVPPPAG